MYKKLVAYRLELDQIDKEIISLLSERKNISLKIGVFKKQMGISVLNKSENNRRKKMFSQIKDGEKIYKLIHKASIDAQS
jgi:chorismate mutase